MPNAINIYLNAGLISPPPHLTFQSLCFIFQLSDFGLGKNPIVIIILFQLSDFGLKLFNLPHIFTHIPSIFSYSGII